MNRDFSKHLFKKYEFTYFNWRLITLSEGWPCRKHFVSPASRATEEPGLRGIHQEFEPRCITYRLSLGKLALLNLVCSAAANFFLKGGLRIYYWVMWKAVGQRVSIKKGECPLTTSRKTIQYPGRVFQNVGC